MEAAAPIYSQVSLNDVFIPSGEIVAREIEGELIIVPLVAGICDLEEELYTLSPTGRAIWALLDGQNRLQDVVAALREEFDAPHDDIERDVIGFVDALLRRRMLVRVRRL